MKSLVQLTGSIVVAVMVAGCGGGSSGDGGAVAGTPPAVTPSEQTPAGTDLCSISQLNQWVDDSMRDYYLFYDQVPVVNLNDYASPEELIRDLRVQPFDAFSYVSDSAETNALFEEGKEFGLGHRWLWDENDEPRIRNVQRDSPMGLAGVKRSDVILSVNDVLWADLDDERYFEFIGDRDNPKTATWSFRDGADGTAKIRDIKMSEYSIKTVLHKQTITHPDYDGEIGYLVFNRFLETSDTELDEAMAIFRERNIRDLVVDLRYNGGGRTRVARKLASQIAGPSTDGKLLIQYRFNNKYSDQNYTREFSNESLNLNLGRVIILTTDRTASSSEIVINSLKPYIEVVTIGSRSRGKPYISSGRDKDNCNKRIHALEAEGSNASGVSVFGGIEATCYAADDLSSRFGVGDQNSSPEGMLLSALEYVMTGRCDVAPITAAETDPRIYRESDSKQSVFVGGAEEEF